MSLAILFMVRLQMYQFSKSLFLIHLFYDTIHCRIVPESSTETSCEKNMDCMSRLGLGIQSTANWMQKRRQQLIYMGLLQVISKQPEDLQIESAYQFQKCCWNTIICTWIYKVPTVALKPWMLPQLFNKFVQADTFGSPTISIIRFCSITLTMEKKSVFGQVLGQSSSSS